MTDAVIAPIKQKRKYAGNPDWRLELSKPPDCNSCVFLRECNYIVKTAKLLISPYCFVDSPFHHRFIKEYGKVIDTVSK